MSVENIICHFQFLKTIVSHGGLHPIISCVLQSTSSHISATFSSLFCIFLYLNDMSYFLFLLSLCLLHTYYPMVDFIIPSTLQFYLHYYCLIPLFQKSFACLNYRICKSFLFSCHNYLSTPLFVHFATRISHLKSKSDYSFPPLKSFTNCLLHIRAPQFDV